MPNRRWLHSAIWQVAIWAIAAGATAATDRPTCRLASLEISKGMPRLAVEQKIQDALGIKPTYSPFANNLVGGTAKYEDEGCTLIVSYARGAPAPFTRTADGKTVHLPPHDEEVLAVELVRSAERTSDEHE